MTNFGNLGLRKSAIALAVAGSFAAGSAQATNADLTTFSQSWDGTPPVVTSNLATLSASSWISGTVAGITSFDWFFQAADYLPWNDYAWVSGAFGTVTLSSVAAVGDFGNSGWNTYTFVTAYSGTLKFGVDNEIDSGVDSTLFIRNVTDVTAVPEPETYAMLLSGLGLLGFVARRRKQKLATA